MMRKWLRSKADSQLVEVLKEELDLPEPVASVLVNRGISEPQEARRFFSPCLRELHPPESLADIDRAVERVLLAVDRKEPIVLYGDYDVDGLASLALLKSFFGSIGVQASTIVPHRERDGYGFHSQLIPDQKGSRALVITVDCGISDHQDVERAQSRGLDVVVTDHHEPGDRLPGAFAVINPKRHDNAYPFRDLAGVGVTFLLTWAIARRLKQKGFWPVGKEPSLKGFLDLVALGTVADQAPLKGENRTLVKHGLNQLVTCQRAGIQALMKVSGLEGRPLTVGSITFQVAPRLNAPGRIDDPQLALKLLLSDDLQEALELATILEGMNRKRQMIEEDILKEAEVAAWDDLQKGSEALVLAAEGWHPGVLGIVASRLVDKFGLPVVLISLKGDEGQGSARTPEGYNILEGLRACSHFLDRFGGHSMAAGLRIHREAIEGFRRGLCKHVREVMGPSCRERVLRIDHRLSPEEIDEGLVHCLTQLEPHGVGNPEPTFEVEGIQISAARKVGRDHLKMVVKHRDMFFDAIGFNLAGSFPENLQGWARLACLPQLREWQGKTSLQLKVKDIEMI